MCPLVSNTVGSHFQRRAVQISVRSKIKVNAKFDCAARSERSPSYDTKIGKKSCTKHTDPIIHNLFRT